MHHCLHYFSCLIQLWKKGCCLFCSRRWLAISSLVSINFSINSMTPTRSVNSWNNGTHTLMMRWNDCPKNRVICRRGQTEVWLNRITFKYVLLWFVRNRSLFIFQLHLQHGKSSTCYLSLGWEFLYVSRWSWPFPVSLFIKLLLKIAYICSINLCICINTTQRPVTMLSGNFCMFVDGLGISQCHCS